MRRPMVAFVAAIAVLALIGGLWLVFGDDDDTTELAFPGWMSVPFSLAQPVSVGDTPAQVLYRGDVACEQGERLEIRIRITQGDVEGEGEIEGNCTGEVQRFEVPVTADGPGFEVGEEAEYWGWAGTFVNGEEAAEPWEWEGTTVVLDG